MAKQETAETKWLQGFVMLWGIAMVFGLIATQASQAGSTIFDLRFNAYALISLVSVLVNLGFIITIIGKRKEFKSNEVTWYFLFLCTLIFFGSFEMLQRLSATPHGALFWAQISGVGPAFESVGLFLFVLLFTSPRSRRLALIPVVILSSGLLLFFHGNGSTIFLTSDSAIKLYPWGYNNDIGPAFVLNIAWALGMGVLSIGILTRFYRRTQNVILKKQTKLFMIAISVPFFGALVFDALAPIFGLKAPPLQDIFTVATAGLMLYGFRHYKVFQVTPASLATDILSTMTESVVVTDGQLKIQLMNSSAKSIFGSQNQEHLDSNVTLLELFGPDQAPKIKDAISHVTNSGDKHVIGNFLLSQNKQIYVRITAAKITEDHGVEGYVFAISDVSELQKSYDDLEREKESVELKVQERTKELREAQERLAETDKIKTEFVILTSHNLRTPLTTIRGSLEFLADSQLNENQKKFVNNLQVSSKRLSSLVEELLTISEIESGNKTGLKLVELKEIIEPLKSEAEELAKQNKNKFEFNGSFINTKVNANPARLVTAIHNLLDNAFKFTKDGVVAMKVENDNGKIKIQVSDTGTGIKESEIPKLFTKFHRGTSVMQYDYEGEGIGLYLTKLIIDEHKGKIDVDSKLGEGTTFTITLPI